MDWLGDVARLLTAATAITGGVFAIYRYFALRERTAAVRIAFSQAVDLLSSDDAVHRRTGAIMLRRFFDPKTEQGGKRTPYAGEALNVIAAVLRGTETGSLQKLLADGLAYAPDLRGADLQKTNLQQAYLGERAGRTVDLSEADFYRADLSGASLKGAVARNAVFYQSRVVNTVFRNTDLTGANFYEADVGGAVFKGAQLDGANFAHARNVPEDIAGRLGEGGIYGGPVSDEQATPTSPVVFFSRPGAADIEVRRYLWALADRVEQQGFAVAEVDRASYAATGAVAEVRRVMHGCSGVVVCAVADLNVASATWRSATPETREVSNVGLTSPWTMLELGVAVGLGLPVLLSLGDGVDPEVFDFGLAEPGVSLLHFTDDHRSQAFRERFDDWVGAVREAARR